MRSIGLSELVASIPITLIALLFSGVVFFSIWKFHRMLSKINDNLVGIRRQSNQPRFFACDQGLFPWQNCIGGPFKIHRYQPLLNYPLPVLFLSCGSERIAIGYEQSIVPVVGVPGCGAASWLSSPPGVWAVLV